MSTRMLYKYPGPYEMQDGKYDQLIVEETDEKALNAALKDGWCYTMPEARTGEKPVPAKPPKVEGTESTETAKPKQTAQSILDKAKNLVKG